MNTPTLDVRPLDDIDVREEEAGDSYYGERRIEFATFTEGEYVESIFVAHARAAEIYRDLGALLGKTGSSRNPSVSDREAATVLAALRYWQRQGLLSSGHEQDVAEDAGRFAALSASEIDSLCERINSEGFMGNPMTPHRGQSETCVTPGQLREATDALREAAEMWRDLADSEAKDKAIRHMIAETYEHTAQALDRVLRILERDQAVLAITKVSMSS